MTDMAEKYENCTRGKIYLCGFGYGYPGQLSLAIPPRLGKMSTGNDYSHRQQWRI